MSIKLMILQNLIKNAIKQELTQKIYKTHAFNFLYDVDSNLININSLYQDKMLTVTDRLI